MSIFDLIKAPELTAYWEEHTQDMPPYLGEELFPADKKLGLKLDWIKGAMGLPVVLKPSAFDVGAVPRPRIGFDMLSAEMPFFKESTYIDEELRQQLNMVLETRNQNYIDAVTRRIFNDQTRLLDGARARREEMRMMALTTGAIAITANGQAYNYDYGVPAEHKVTANTSWADLATADPIEDMRGWMDKAEADTGVRPTRGICTRKTWGYLRNNQKILKSIFVLSNGQVGAVSDARLTQYLLDELGLELIVYSKQYKSDAGVATKFVPDDTISLFPEGQLGTTWFGTTPEESDLMGGKVANVSVTDLGVAVTTIEKADPVNVETKVTMICLPSFEAADSVIIADVAAD
jgi:hypothetical protein